MTTIRADERLFITEDIPLSEEQRQVAAWHVFQHSKDSAEATETLAQLGLTIGQARLGAAQEGR